MWINLGNIKAKLTEFEAALELYEHALSINPDDSDIHGKKGMAFELLHKQDEALAELNRAVDLNRRNTSAWNTLGTIHFDRDDVEQAKKSFIKAIAANRDNKNAWNNLALVYEKLGNKEKSGRCLQYIKEME